MTEESSDALSADRGGKQLPKGIHIVEADPLMASKEKVVPRRPLAETWGSTSEKPTSWSYLYLRHFAVKTFKKCLEHYNEQTEGRPQPFFIHQSYHYEYKNPEKQRGSPPSADWSFSRARCAICRPSSTSISHSFILSTTAAAVVPPPSRTPSCAPS